MLAIAWSRAYPSKPGEPTVACLAVGDAAGRVTIWRYITHVAHLI